MPLDLPHALRVLAQTTAFIVTGLQAKRVMFQAAVTEPVAHICEPNPGQPPTYLVRPYSPSAALPKPKSPPTASTPAHDSTPSCTDIVGMNSFTVCGVFASRRRCDAGAFIGTFTGPRNRLERATLKAY